MIKTKQEYIDSLRRALTGQIEAAELEEHIRYYEDYITAEARIRGSEEEVIRSLGDPKLIAMSICAADEAAGKKDSGETYTEYEENRCRDDVKGDNRPFFLRHPRILFWGIIAVVIAFAVLLALVAFWLLQLLWPVVLIVIGIVVIARVLFYFKSR